MNIARKLNQEKITVRLTDKEVNSIKKAVFAFDPKALIYLFGSRTDNTKRGGDIDLLVISQSINIIEVTRIRLKIFDYIGEQKIDIVTATSETETPFIKSILSEAIRL